MLSFLGETPTIALQNAQKECGSEAVVISTDEYERLKEIEELMNNIEHKEIYQTIQERKRSQKTFKIFNKVFWSIKL